MVKRWVLSGILFLIKGYRVCLSPFLTKRCRFYPSCSEYAQEAFEHYGVSKGTWLTVKRLIKCGPWHPGGIDCVRSSL